MIYIKLTIYRKQRNRTNIFCSIKKRLIKMLKIFAKKHTHIMPLYKTIKNTVDNSYWQKHAKQNKTRNQLGWNKNDVILTTIMCAGKEPTRIEYNMWWWCIEQWLVAAVIERVRKKNKTELNMMNDPTLVCERDAFIKCQPKI